MKNVIYKNISLVSILLYLFFSYGHLWQLLSQRYKGSFQLGLHSYLIPLYTLIFILNLVFRQKLSKLAPVFIKLNILIIAALLVRFSVNYYQSLKQPLANQNLPDIYYLIFDEYARQDTLAEEFGFDNSDLIDFLETKGFFVASNSHANYPITFMSLASSLNFNYLNQFITIKDSDNIAPYYQLIKHSQLKKELESLGYQYDDLSASFTDFNKLQRLVITTALNPLLTIDTFHPFLPQALKPLNKRQLVFNKLDLLKDISNPNQPRFVFAHLKLPHHQPYYTDQRGKAIYTSEADQKQQYLDQLIFANQQIKEIVNKLLSDLSQPPIIIIQSDTGPRFLQFHSELSNQFTQNQINERLRILNAYYLPDRENNLLYDSITPVNSFRIILNQYFNKDLPLLEDKNYMATYKYPYRFYPVAPDDSVIN